MVNSGSFNSEGDPNATAGYIQANGTSESSQSPSRLAVTNAQLCNNDLSETADSDLSSVAHGIESTTPTKTEFNSSMPADEASNYAASTDNTNADGNMLLERELGLNNDGDADDKSTSDKASLFCSVPLEKIQKVLTLVPPSAAVKPPEECVSPPGEIKVKQNVRKLLCLYCDRSFVSANLRQKHVERVHSAKQNRRVSSRRLQSQLTTTPCVYCDKFTSVEHSLEELFEHLLADHSSKYFACLLCKERYLNSSLLLEHNASIHTTISPPAIEQTLKIIPLPSENNSLDNINKEACESILFPRCTSKVSLLKDENLIIPLERLKSPTDINKDSKNMGKKEEVLLNHEDNSETAYSEELPVKLTRSKMRITFNTNQKQIKSANIDHSNKSKHATFRQLRNRKMTVKTSKIVQKRSKRLQAIKIMQESQKKKRSSKAIDKKLTPNNKVEQSNNSTKLGEKSTKTSSSCINPYPEFDSNFRVKKITDHSIDNLKISSLKFDDVFDKAFFNRIQCNIQENLLHHIDGKLFKNEESENRISNFEKISSVSQEIQNANSENYGCDISLNAVTPVTSLLSTSQFGEDPESQIEYGSKPSKKKTTTTRSDEVHYKYFTRRKYQASILEHKENRDLSKLDMWTQLVIKSRQQKMVDDKKSAKEMLEYTACEEYKTRKRREELNRILDRRGPFEDLKEETSKKAALEKLNSDSHNSISEESFTEIREILQDMLSKVFELTSSETQETIDNTIIDPTTSPNNNNNKLTKTADKNRNELSEIPSYLNLRRSSSLPSEGEIDKSDKIALICSSQETEYYELPSNSVRGKNEVIELTGEWARSRIYVCAACGTKVSNIKLLLEHKNVYHQYVWTQHYELVGNQSELYRHLSIPGLGKVGFVEDTSQSKFWRRSDARICTKCSRQCNALGELHRHMLECGGDWTWMLARKKCKYRPFGAKSRRKRRGLVKRIHIQKSEQREKKLYKKTFDGPRQRPSDADSIQRMLANLPAKRATRKEMSLKDGYQRNNQPHSTLKPQSKMKCGKIVKRTRKITNDNPLKTSQKPVIVRSTRNLNQKGFMNNRQTNRRNLRSLNKVLASRILDTNSTLLVKRKLKSLNNRRITRQISEKVKIVETETKLDVTNDNPQPIIEQSPKRKSISKSLNNEEVENNKEELDNDNNNVEQIRLKRSSPRNNKEEKVSKKLSVKNMLSGKLNIKSFFPVKKKKILEKVESTKAEIPKTLEKVETKAESTKADTETTKIEDKIEIEPEQIITKKTKKDRVNKFVRSLSFNKKKVKETTNIKNETKIIEEEEENVNKKKDVTKLSKKRKLRNSFRNVLNKVKKLKTDEIPDIIVQVDGSPQNSVETNNKNDTENDFLENPSPDLSEHNTLPQVEKIIIPSASEKSESTVDIAPIVINFEPLKNTSLDETIFNLQSNNEKNLQAKGELNFDATNTKSNELSEENNRNDLPECPTSSNNLLSVDVNLKGSVSPLSSPKLKGKIKKPARGLNDCIAMLTSKLQQKSSEDISKIEEPPKIIDEVKSIIKPPSLGLHNQITIHQSAMSGKCDIENFKEAHANMIPKQKVTDEPVCEALDLSKKSTYKNEIPLEMTTKEIPKIILNSVDLIIQNVIDNNGNKGKTIQNDTTNIIERHKKIDDIIQKVIDNNYNQNTETTYFPNMSSKNSFLDDIIDSVASGSYLKRQKEIAIIKQTLKEDIIKIPVFHFSRPVNMFENLSKSTLEVNNESKPKPNNKNKQTKKSNATKVLKTVENKSKNDNTGKEKMKFLETNLDNLMDIKEVECSGELLKSTVPSEIVTNSNNEQEKNIKESLQQEYEPVLLENKMVPKIMNSDSEDELPLSVLKSTGKTTNTDGNDPQNFEAEVEVTQDDQEIKKDQRKNSRGRKKIISEKDALNVKKIPAPRGRPRKKNITDNALTTPGADNESSTDLKTDKKQIKNKTTNMTESTTVKEVDQGNEEETIQLNETLQNNIKITESLTESTSDLSQFAENSAPKPLKALPKKDLTSEEINSNSETKDIVPENVPSNNVQILPVKSGRKVNNVLPLEANIITNINTDVEKYLQSETEPSKEASTKSRRRKKSLITSPLDHSLEGGKLSDAPNSIVQKNLDTANIVDESLKIKNLRLTKRKKSLERMEQKLVLSQEDVSTETNTQIIEKTVKLRRKKKNIIVDQTEPEQLSVLEDNIVTEKSPVNIKSSSKPLDIDTTLSPDIVESSTEQENDASIKNESKRADEPLILSITKSKRIEKVIADKKEDVQKVAQDDFNDARIIEESLKTPVRSNRKKKQSELSKPPNAEPETETFDGIVRTPKSKRKQKSENPVVSELLPQKEVFEIETNITGSAQKQNMLRIEVKESDLIEEPSKISPLKSKHKKILEQIDVDLEKELELSENELQIETEILNSLPSQSKIKTKGLNQSLVQSKADNVLETRENDTNIQSNLQVIVTDTKRKKKSIIPKQSLQANSQSENNIESDVEIITNRPKRNIKKVKIPQTEETVAEPLMDTNIENEHAKFSDSVTGVSQIESGNISFKSKNKNLKDKHYMSESHTNIDVQNFNPVIKITPTKLRRKIRNSVSEQQINTEDVIAEIEINTEIQSQIGDEKIKITPTKSRKKNTKIDTETPNSCNEELNDSISTSVGSSSSDFNKTTTDKTKNKASKELKLVEKDIVKISEGLQMIDGNTAIEKPKRRKRSNVLIPNDTLDAVEPEILQIRGKRKTSVSTIESNINNEANKLLCSSIESLNSIDDLDNVSTPNEKTTIRKRRGRKPQIKTLQKTDYTTPEDNENVLIDKNMILIDKLVPNEENVSIFIEKLDNLNKDNELKVEISPTPKLNRKGSTKRAPKIKNISLDKADILNVNLENTEVKCHEEIILETELKLSANTLKDEIKCQEEIIKDKILTNNLIVNKRGRKPKNKSVLKIMKETEDKMVEIANIEQTNVTITDSNYASVNVVLSKRSNKKKKTESGHLDIIESEILNNDNKEKQFLLNNEALEKNYETTLLLDTNIDHEVTSTLNKKGRKKKSKKDNNTPSGLFTVFSDSTTESSSKENEDSLLSDSNIFISNKDDSIENKKIKLIIKQNPLAICKISNKNENKQEESNNDIKEIDISNDSITPRRTTRRNSKPINYREVDTALETSDEHIEESNKETTIESNTEENEENISQGTKSNETSLEEIKNSSECKDKPKRKSRKPTKSAVLSAEIIYVSKPLDTIHYTKIENSTLNNKHHSEISGNDDIISNKNSIFSQEDKVVSNKGKEKSTESQPSPQTPLVVRPVKKCSIIAESKLKLDDNNKIIPTEITSNTFEPPKRNKELNFSVEKLFLDKVPMEKPSLLPILNIEKLTSLNVFKEKEIDKSKDLLYSSQKVKAFSELVQINKQKKSDKKIKNNVCIEESESVLKLEEDKAIITSSTNSNKYESCGVSFVGEIHSKNDNIEPSETNLIVIKQKKKTKKIVKTEKVKPLELSSAESNESINTLINNDDEFIKPKNQIWTDSYPLETHLRNDETEPSEKTLTVIKQKRKTKKIVNSEKIKPLELSSAESNELLNTLTNNDDEFIKPKNKIRTKKPLKNKEFELESEIMASNLEEADDDVTKTRNAKSKALEHILDEALSELSESERYKDLLVEQPTNILIENTETDIIETENKKKKRGRKSLKDKSISLESLEENTDKITVQPQNEDIALTESELSKNERFKDLLVEQPTNVLIESTETDLIETENKKKKRGRKSLKDKSISFESLEENTDKFSVQPLNEDISITESELSESERFKDLLLEQPTNVVIESTVTEIIKTEIKKKKRGRKSVKNKSKSLESLEESRDKIPVQPQNEDIDDITETDELNISQDIRRSRRSARKVTSYNENYLSTSVESLDEETTKKKPKKNDTDLHSILEKIITKEPEVNIESVNIPNQITFLEVSEKDFCGKSVQPDLKQNDNKQINKERKLNSDELFDLLKSSSPETDFPKPASNFLSGFDEISDFSSDSNHFDNVFENILEIEENFSEPSKSNNDVILKETEQNLLPFDNLTSITKEDEINQSNNSINISEDKSDTLPYIINSLDHNEDNSKGKDINTATEVDDLNKEEEKPTETFCEICNKHFRRPENLLKHKRTLTHISKLSEIEAKHPSKSNKGEENLDEPPIKPSEIEEHSISDSSKSDINITNLLEKSEKVSNTISRNDSGIISSNFPLSSAKHPLKLCDIIDDVLNKPVLDRDNGKHSNFSDIILQNSSDIPQEYRRYKSLGERKSFESESSLTTTENISSKLSIENNFFTPQLSDNTEKLEKQITLLQTMIENQTGNKLSYIDEISVSSNQSNFASPRDSPISVASSTRQEDSNNLTFSSVNASKKSVKECSNENNFIKPSQYEEISEDSTNVRNYEDQKSRKVLNRDEELFLECCSLLKSGSEISNYSKKSNKVSSSINHVDIKAAEDEPDWMEKKTILKKPVFEVHNEYSGNSRISTPLGDSFNDEMSNSNTISSNWNMNRKDNCAEEQFKQTDGNRSFVFSEISNRDDSSEKIDHIEQKSDQKFNSFTKSIKGQFHCSTDKLKNRSEEITNLTDTVVENNLEKTDETNGLSVEDNKKMPTKGALKVFEGLKVSIPTEELNMSKVLNHFSPIQRKSDLLDNQETTEKVHKTDESVQKEPLKLFRSPVKVAKKTKAIKHKIQFGNKFTFKLAKKKNITRVFRKKKQSNKKIPDIYDFEETQDNSDVFTKPDFRSFRNKKVEGSDSKITNAESDNDSQTSTGAEVKSVSSASSISNTSVKKPKKQLVTKKKCMIMGRIFKNVLKSKIEDIPVIDNTELVENYVNTCTKISENDVEQLHNDKLIENMHLKDNKNKADSKVEVKKRSKVLKARKRNRLNSDSTDDEFSINKTKKRTYRKNAKAEDNCINLEQELKECIGVASRKSQRKCTSGKQNVLVEYWSSDDSSFEALLESQIIYPNPNKTVENLQPEVEEKIVDTEENVQAELKPPVEPLPVVQENKIKKQIRKKPKSEKKILEAKVEEKLEVTNSSNINNEGNENNGDTLISNRRKRAAADPLYHWSSSSEDESQDLIEIKPIRDELDDDDDRPVQHGWIVGDSPKKLVTMLAQAKGKKTDSDCVKEQGKKRTNNSNS